MKGEKRIERNKMFNANVVVLFSRLRCIRLLIIPWTAVYQASLSFMIFQSLPKFISLWNIRKKLENTTRFPFWRFSSAPNILCVLKNLRSGSNKNIKSFYQSEREIENAAIENINIIWALRGVLLVILCPGNLVKKNWSFWVSRSELGKP